MQTKPGAWVTLTKPVIATQRPGEGSGRTRVLNAWTQVRGSDLGNGYWVIRSVAGYVAIVSGRVIREA
jgi:hypothetical protein